MRCFLKCETDLFLSSLFSDAQTEACTVFEVCMIAGMYVYFEGENK